MTRSELENESLNFPPVEPPPFPGAQPEERSGMRPKSVVMVVLVALVVISVGTTYFIRKVTGPDAAATSAASEGAPATSTAPRTDISPATVRIGERHTTAQRAICDYSKQMATYEPAALEGYFAAAIASTTGAYRQRLIDTNAATRNYLSATGSRSRVLESKCGLRSVQGTVALGVAYVKQSTTTASAPNPTVSLVVSMVTAEEQPDGRWLVSDLKRISA